MRRYPFFFRNRSANSSPFLPSSFFSTLNPSQRYLEFRLPSPLPSPKRLRAGRGEGGDEGDLLNKKGFRIPGVKGSNLLSRSLITYLDHSNPRTLESLFYKYSFTPRKVFRWSLQAPNFSIAFRCSFVPYPLCLAKLYWG